MISLKERERKAWRRRTCLRYHSSFRRARYFGTSSKHDSISVTSLFGVQGKGKRIVLQPAIRIFSPSPFVSFPCRACEFYHEHEENRKWLDCRQTNWMLYLSTNHLNSIVFFSRCDANISASRTVDLEIVSLKKSVAVRVRTRQMFLCIETLSYTGLNRGQFLVPHCIALSIERRYFRVSFRQTFW